MLGVTKVLLPAHRFDTKPKELGEGNRVFCSFFQFVLWLLIKKKKKKLELK